jgi:mRNA-degrading endonuclease RelE of RelBE toxin-antitoxin system
MKILVRPSYTRSLKKFSHDEIAEINEAISKLSDSFGHPHVHSGLSIRKLRKAIFEIRAGLDIRILFTRESRDIVLVLAGDHDEVRAWLKDNS